MNFKPSDKVVCIADMHDNALGLFRRVGPTPQKNKVYVVERVIENARVPDDLGLAFVGITSFWVLSGNECGYSYTCFRKLEEIQAENKLKREQEEAAALKEATQLINSEP